MSFSTGAPMVDLWFAWPIPTMLAVLIAAAVAFCLLLIQLRLAHGSVVELTQGAAMAPVAQSRRHFLMLLVAAAFLATLSVVQFGPTGAAIAAVVYSTSLVSLGVTDHRTGFLPDVLTISLLWAGLLVNLDSGFSDLEGAVLGAVSGYLFLGAVAWLFLRLTGRQGMGNGDLKLLAAIGAWLGWSALPLVLLISCASALLVEIPRRISGRSAPDAQISFGPYLAFAGIFYLLWPITPVLFL